MYSAVQAQHCCTGSSTVESLVVLLLCTRITVGTVSSSGAVETAVCCINSTNITSAASVVQVQCTEFFCDVHNTNSTTVLHSQYLYYTRVKGSNDTMVKNFSFLERVGIMSDSIYTGSDTEYKLRVAHSCRAVLMLIHRQRVTQSKTSTQVGVCALLVK